MLKFRSEAEVLKEWDDVIARVKAGEVSLEDAEAFKLKKGSSRQGRQPRDWGENARRRSSGICFYQSSITRVKWDRAMANRRSWGVSDMAQTPLSPGLEKFGGQAASRAYAQ